MELLNKLIREIEESPQRQVCSVCLGKGSILSQKRQRFFSKYTEDALATDSKFYVAEKAWREANKPNSEEVLRIFLDVGLSEQEGKDFHILYLQEQDIEDCHNCENGRELTEHGALVAKLHNAIILGD